MLKPTMPASRSYRFGTSKPMTHPSPKEVQSGSSKAKATRKPPQTPPVDAKDIVVVVENARDQLLSHGGIPSEQDVLAALRQCDKAASLVHDILAKHLSGTAAKSDTSASSLLSLDGSKAALTQSRDTKVSEAIDDLSQVALDIVSQPTVLITPQVLDLYIETQARLGRVETLPHVLALYATKPKPRSSRGSLKYVKQSAGKAANAIDPDIVEKALDATIEAKNLDAAVGVIENTYATHAFGRAKLLKKALLPASVAVATPFAVYVLASNLSQLQDSLDQRTATVVATAGIMTYVGCIPLRERWIREEERAALDKVACTFGFSQSHRFGEEEGLEFQALREFILRKGMVLDRVELMEASWRFGHTTERIGELGAHDRERDRHLRHCFWFCLVFGSVAFFVVVLEAFVIAALQFCDGEPLVSLYWATWTMLQVGGLIAIWGICLHVRHMITGKKHPPWALALGTPVLVVAGLGHYFQGKLRRSRAARSIKERSRSRGRSWGRQPEALSEVPTIRASSSESNRRENGGDTPAARGDSSGEYNAKVIGYTKDGDIIIRLAPNTREDFMTMAPLTSSITWDEPIRAPSTGLEGNTSRKQSITRGRSVSRVSFKGKEKENIGRTKDEEVDIADIGEDEKENAIQIEEV
ncbi:hypothetical protein VMCG_00988 [Cytospora schulzeri]|uniref:Uncharacterized protein n=1 Tax=Cytospora schulzeri TaxID=448051 RepID=A0A423X6H0_9PEZI|nr:hypothetical protein VMCG_00988 [Valsa malicola]